MEVEFRTTHSPWQPSTHYAVFFKDLDNSSEQEISCEKSVITRQLQLEVSHPIAVDIPLQHSIAAVGKVAQLPGHIAKGPSTDQREGIIGRRRRVGIDRGQLDFVSSTDKVRDDIP